MKSTQAVGIGGTRRLLRGAFTLFVALCLTSCRMGVLDPVGPIGAAERTILLNATAIMLVIIAPTIVLTLVFAWWFRASNTKARYRPDWEYSGRLELLVWSIPALVIIFLAGITWVGSHDLEPSEPLQSKVEPLEVDVVALDWKWLFIYPGENVASINKLVVPVGTPLSFRITSATVMNSFFIPQFGSQIYAMAGMQSRLHLQADKPGTYAGLSAHYSGEGFADMNFNVDAVTPAQFSTWVMDTRKAGPTLDRAAYLTLARTFETARPSTFSAVAEGIFETAIDEAVAPAHQAAQHSGE